MPNEKNMEVTKVDDYSLKLMLTTTKVEEQVISLEDLMNDRERLIIQRNQILANMLKESERFDSLIAEIEGHISTAEGLGLKIRSKEEKDNEKVNP